MTRRTLLSILLTVLILGFAACAPEPDHFWVYEVDGVEAGFHVRLTDQFDPDAKDAELRALSHFANPTRKVHSGNEAGVQDGNRHLTWYLLDQRQEEPRRTIRFLNQFGQHSVDVQNPRFLLVPAQKTSDDGSAFPKSLDHYKCYEVLLVNTAPDLPVVTLGDQFGSQQNVQVGPPRLFCLPAVKEREGEETHDIKDKETHLAVYEIRPQERPVDISARDQFGERSLHVIRSVWLAVPTEKQAVATQG